MAKKSIVTAVVLLLVASCLLWWWSTRPENASALSKATPQESPAASPIPQAVASAVPIATGSESEYPQISLKGRSREDAIREYLSHEEKDHFYDWKIPIKFYGKVLDQYSRPVSEATVHLQWVNRQGSEGVGESVIETDGNGQFSLDGVKGKHLGVKISKEGYYDVSGAENQIDFEYANPGEQTFYQPNAVDPVIFHMRKKGAVEQIVKKSLELQPPGSGAPVIVDLLTGQLSATGQLEIQTWKPQITPQQIRTGKVFPYDWRIVLKITDGGFIEEHEVFPFEAPESGYNPVIDLSLHATNGGSGGVTAQQDCYFSFGQPPKYGKLHFSSDGDRPYLDIEYSFNPSGSRNLESDSSQQ